MAKQENRNTLSTSVLVRRFLPYFRKYRKTMAFDLCCAALTTVCELVLPLIVRTITTRATYDVASLTVPFVLMMGGVYMLLRVIDAAANYYMQSIGHIMGSQLETDMRHDIFHHLQELSFGYYSDTKVGQIMARITSDLFEITEFAHHCPEEFLIAGVKILVSFIILCTMNIPMTLMMFAVLPFMLYFAKRFNTKMRQIFKERNKQVGEINAQVEDSLLGIRVVKSFANEEIEEKKFADGNAKFLDLKAQSYRVMAQFGTSNRIFDGLMYIVIVVGGALFIKAGRLSAADFMAYLLYANVLLNSIRRIVEFTEQFQRGMTGIDRFLEIMDAPAEIVDAPDAKVLTDVKGEVAFDHVSFHYQDDDAEVIHNLNMTVRPGQSIALVGPSGAGKTTLCNLIPRFYDATKGQVTLLGQPITAYSKAELNRHVAVVMQKAQLFKGTIRSNLLWGNENSTDEELWHALSIAQSEDFVRQKPGKLDDPVEQGGRNLSGGQRQRLTIARALVGHPDILILDDSASALDYATDAALRKALRTLPAETTLFIVSQRTSSLRHADQIIVLDDGHVVGIGKHDTLMQTCEVYREIHESQFRKGSDVQ
jgi:ATP-binding cassette subfamily B protein